MTPRLNIFQAAPDSAKALMEVEKTFLNSGLDLTLQHLVKVRASQINGCAFCIHMHVSEALKHGENPMRLQLLDAWRDSPLFDDRERAALNWTEQLTRIAKTHAPDEDYEQLKGQFSDSEIAYLTLVIAQINAWNRIQISLRAIHPVAPRATVAA